MGTPYAWHALGVPEPRSPKDTFITVYGRKPVQEALEDEGLRVDKVILADDGSGAHRCAGSCRPPAPAVFPCSAPRRTA